MLLYLKADDLPVDAPVSAHMFLLCGCIHSHHGGCRVHTQCDECNKVRSNKT